MTWDFDPTLVELGPLGIRWYGVCFVAGLYLAIFQLERAFKRRDFPVQHAHSLSLWMPVGMIVGAHLVHLAFYEPRAFVDDPIRIVQIGYGLASHGGGLGALIALWWLCRKWKAPLLRYLDACMVASVQVFPWVRLGNFFNSEIVGRTTDVPWGVVFVRAGYRAPRHPSQLYEVLLGISLIVLTMRLERRRDRLAPGVILFSTLTIYFAARSVLEYFKEYQILAPGFPLTMGQCLSLPLVAACGWGWWRSVKRARGKGGAGA